MKFILVFLSAVVVITYSARTPKSNISTSGELDKLFFDSLFTSDTDSGINFEVTDNNAYHPIKQNTFENDTFEAQAKEVTIKGAIDIYPAITNPQLATFGSGYIFEFDPNTSLKILYQSNKSMQLDLFGSSFSKSCDVFETIFKVDDFIDSIKSLPDIINGNTTIYFGGEVNCNRNIFNGEYPWFKKITENSKFLEEFARPDTTSITVWIRNQESSPSVTVASTPETDHGKSYISTSGYYDRKFFDDMFDADRTDPTYLDGINFANNDYEMGRRREWLAKKNTNTAGINEEVYSKDIDVAAHFRMIVKGFITTNERTTFAFVNAAPAGPRIDWRTTIIGIGGESIENSAMCDWVTGDYFKKADFVDSAIANFNRGAIIMFLGTDFPGCNQWQTPIIQNERFNKYFTPAEAWKKKM